MGIGSNWGIYASAFAAAAGGTYVNSTQYVTVTIAALSATGTASVAAPAGTYFISGWTYTTTDTSTDASSLPRITFAGNVITATRGTASVATITCIVCLVDATSSLVTSVQFGTTALSSGQATNTSTIAAVTNTRAHPVFLGQSTTGSQSYSGNMCKVSLAGTTVTVTKQFAGSTETVAWQVIEWAAGALNSSVQSFAVSATRSGITTWTQAVSSVTMANSMLFYGGQYANVTNNQATFFQRAALTSPTAVTFNINTAGSVLYAYNFSLVEFAAGVLTANAVQRGTTTLTATTSNNSTVTSISTTKSVMTMLGNTTTTTTANSATGRHNITQGSATTITETVNTSGTGTGSWEIGEFN